MCRLDQSILIRPVFLEFLLEKLLLIIGNGFLVQNQDLGDVVVVGLVRSAWCRQTFQSSMRTFSFRSLST